MRILSIEFTKHPILGNLKLDFTDSKGKPVDTIILAGENGCGKTTILEELSKLWDTSDHNVSYKGRYITTRICLDEIELHHLIQTIKVINRIPVNATGIFEVKEDLSVQGWNSFEIKYQQKESGDFVPGQSFLMVQLQSFAKSIFSTVDINYISEDNITTIRSATLDSDLNNRKKSDQHLAQKINQILVDIDALDSSDLKAWTLEHIGMPAPKNIISPRIERFSSAFSTMFDDLHFFKIDNKNNAKLILFKKDNVEIPISQLSSGEKQIVYRGAFFLKDIKNDIGSTVLIDEPEISLHPEWQKRIVNYYQKLFTDESGKQLSQIFITTHSPFIIHSSMRHDDKVIVLQKNAQKEIIQSDKPEYYDCNSCKVIEDSFSVYDFEEKQNNPVVFLEGRTDEMYFNKAKELYGNPNFNYTFQWVGHIKDNGDEEFTGKDALNQTKSFMVSNKNLFSSKYILLYDCDTNKKTEYITENLIIKSLKKQEHPKYKKGIENLLKLPKDFDYSKYYEQKEINGDYGEIKKIQEFKKMNLAKDICEKYPRSQQQDVLQKIGEVVMEIEKELFGEVQ